MLDVSKYEPTIPYVLRKWNLPWRRFYEMAFEGLEESCKKYDESKANNMKPQTFVIYGVERYLGYMIGKDFQWRGIVKSAKERHYIWFLANYHGLIGGANSPEDLILQGKEPRKFDDYSELNVEFFLQNSLTEQERMVAVYRSHGYTLQEIGDIIGCSKQNVNLIMKRIKRKMILYFGEETCSGRTTKYEKSRR